MHIVYIDVKCTMKLNHTWYYGQILSVNHMHKQNILWAFFVPDNSHSCLCFLSHIYMRATRAGKKVLPPENKQENMTVPHRILQGNAIFINTLINKIVLLYFYAILSHSKANNILLNPWTYQNSNTGKYHKAFCKTAWVMGSEM